MKDSCRALNLYYLARKDFLYGYFILRQLPSDGLRKECVLKRKAPKRVNFGGERSMVECFVYPSSEAGMVGMAPFCVQTKALTFTASL